jgi:hypothetical protein
MIVLVIFERGAQHAPLALGEPRNVDGRSKSRGGFADRPATHA